MSNLSRYREIVNELGEDYLDKLGIDSNLENTIPAYELADIVCKAYDDLYRDFKSREAEHEQPKTATEIREELYRKLDSNKTLAEIYIWDFNRGEWHGVKARDYADIVLNQAKFKFKNLENMLDYLEANPAEKTADVNNRALYNHIKFIAKRAIVQYYQSKGKLKWYGKNQYYLDESISIEEALEIIRENGSKVEK